MNEMENNQPELVIVPLALMNDILAFLGTKPYTEVAPYINAIQKNSKLIPNEEVVPVQPIPEAVTE